MAVPEKRSIFAVKYMIMRRGLLFCLVGGLFSVLGCAMKKMPEGELVRVEFSRHGTMARAEFEGCVEQDSTGAFVLRAMKETYGPLFEKRLDAETMDGWGWSFSARFSDGSVISSHGENARPRDDGLKRIRSYMQELVQDGVQIEFLEEE